MWRLLASAAAALLLTGPSSADGTRAMSTMPQGAQSSWGSMYVATSDVTVASTSPTSTFGSGNGTKTFAANTLTVGRSFIIAFNGRYSTPALNPATVTIGVTMSGPGTLATTTTGSLPTSATGLPFDGFLRCTVRAGTGPTARAMKCNGMFSYATALSGVANTQNALLTPSAGIPFDSTVAQTMDATAAWSQVTTHTATVDQGYIDLRN